MQLSVLLPTCRRPEMLKTALASIAAQTAVSRVAEIVVVENGTNRESENICRDFPSLPINYVYRDDPIPPGYHSIKDAMKYISSKHLAILFDDDWWLESHLQRGIDSFELKEDVVASYGACAWIESEDGYITDLFGQFNMWFASDIKPIDNKWIFRLKEMLVANLLSTTFHFSSLIVDREVWVESLNIIRDGNPFDTDRLISVELSRLGCVIVDRIPGVLIRRHSEQEGVRMNNVIGQTWFNKSSEKLLKLADSHNVDLQREFRLLMESKGISVDALFAAGNFNSIDLLISVGILSNINKNPNDSRIKRLYKGKMPASLQTILARFRAHLNSINPIRMPNISPHHPQSKILDATHFIDTHE